MTLIKSISGIRGTIGGTPGNGLTPVDILKFTAAFGKWIMQKSGKNKIVIGRDARISGEMVRNLIAGTLQSIGADVIDLGLSTTPTVEIAVPEYNTIRIQFLLPKLLTKQEQLFRHLNSHNRLPL